jgi:hypothetical protein
MLNILGKLFLATAKDALGIRVQNSRMEHVGHFFYEK